MKPLTPRMLEVVRLMQGGWPMGVSTSSFVGNLVWLQQDGVGHGGPTLKLNAATFQGLVDRGLIRLKKHGFPTAEWELTEAGKALEVLAT